MSKSRKSKRRPWWRGLLRFMVLLPVRYWYITLGIIILPFLYWQRYALAYWTINTVNSTLRLFGWGLIFIFVAIGTLVGVLWRRKLSSVMRHWNYWLGSIAFTLATWGVLAYIPGRGILRGASLGGNFGLSVIGYTDLTGISRIAGLVIIGIVLVAPRTSIQIVAKSISWLGGQLKRQPVPRPSRRQKPPLPSVTETPKPLEMEPGRKVSTPVSTPVSAPAPAEEELKQVAQEVWKKYGESPEVVTVDGWRLPPVDILDRSPEIQFSQADNVQRAKLIEEALGSYGVEAKVVQINAGPTVTQFGVEPGWDRKMKEIKEKDKDGSVKARLEEVSKTRVKVDRISSLANDLALALAAPSIRIEAPVPGKSVVGVEVPNTVSSLVSLRGVIETSVFQKMQARAKLILALGKGAGGEAIAADLAKMPHLLVAGATGSGKTVCLNAIICCLLLCNTPNDVRFIMIDPKRVE
ncbi:DNA translocase FtsK, partial [Chloroflexota bacterium]